jgi:hypothetical protein
MSAMTLIDGDKAKGDMLRAVCGRLAGVQDSITTAFI